MQDYKKFIEEIFSLEIGEIERFVKDGVILYGHNPKYYPEGTPEDMLPGFKSKFLDLSQYAEHREVDRYSDRLTLLRENALTDVLLLDANQQSKILTNLKEKRNRLTELIRPVGHYLMNWRNGNYGDPLFLELQVYPAFSVKHRSQNSIDVRFLDDLEDAIKYKRGHLSQLIKQIEGEEVKPAINSNVTVENYKTEHHFAVQIEIIEDLVEVLSPFFQNASSDYLIRLFKGETDGETKLLFNVSGNKLACLFKELIENYATVGNSKVNLEQWIQRNFQYFDKKENKFKDYTETYLNGIISTNGKPCKNPIAVVKRVNGRLTIEPIKQTPRNS